MHVSPPTFPVVLRGCQVHGQVNNDEQSPPLSHVDPHTHTHTPLPVSLCLPQGINITLEDENAPTVRVSAFHTHTPASYAGSFLHSLHSFFLLPPPSIHPLSVCVFSTQAWPSGLSSGNHQDLENACPLGRTVLTATG